MKTKTIEIVRQRTTFSRIRPGGQFSIRPGGQFTLNGSGVLLLRLKPAPGLAEDENPNKANAVYLESGIVTEFKPEDPVDLPVKEDLLSNCRETYVAYQGKVYYVMQDMSVVMLSPPFKAPEMYPSTMVQVINKLTAEMDTK